ncbi:MAG: hypothetical protein MUC95_02755 [Spirochaetes bacterium]|nr:hypothetical protein [Spirochaetota bacterium]
MRVNRQDIPGEYRDAGESYLMMISQRRAAELLESYFKANPGEADRDSFRLEKIPVIVKSGRLACNGCNDDYCEAFADFDAGAVKDIITK